MSSLPSDATRAWQPLPWLEPARSSLVAGACLSRSSRQPSVRGDLMLAVDRICALVAAARRLADPRDPLGKKARVLLPESTGLAPENVELALSDVLETQPSAAEIRALISSVEPATRVHVQLASNVFTAPLRAVALALAQSATVMVRASRREPIFTSLLWEASRAFQLVDVLAPTPGDHVWAYGADATLHDLESTLPAGAVLHAHGSGFGIAVVAAERGEADALARDMVPFDQRGCLSPRVAVAVGSRDEARTFVRQLAGELELAARRVPLGRLDDEERAESVRLRETLSYAGEVFQAGPGWVALDDDVQRLVAAPVGRNLVVVRSDTDLDWLTAHAASIVSVGLGGPNALRQTLGRVLPAARLSALGHMQHPPFDGPVDRRASTRAHAC